MGTLLFPEDSGGRIEGSLPDHAEPAYSGSGETLFSRLIHPRMDPSQWGWNSFEWKSDRGPQNIVLKTESKPEDNYNRAIWVIEEAH